MAKIQKIIETNEGTLCWCSREKLYKPIDMFNINEKGRHTYFCDQCVEEIKLNRTYTPMDSKKYSDQVLKLLGYDLDSYISIHEQFKRKHNINNDGEPK
jgi:hypothetical protein